MSSKNIKVLEELQEKVLPIDDAELSDDSEITKPIAKANISQGQNKEKKPYVLTPARKAQFEKARQIRDENREQRKQDKDADIKIHDDIKNDLIRKKELKAIRKKTREIKSIVAKASEISSEDEIIIKTPKLKTKKPPTYKKKVVYESSSDESSDESSSEEEVIQKKKKHYPPPSTPKSEPKRVIQYF
jgi:hypothetical protein